MQDYIEQVLRTESKDLNLIQDRICNSTIIRLDHAADGMCTEAGEFKDVLKKWKYYGKEIDFVNLEEELGDLCYYIGLACDVLGTDFNKIHQKILKNSVLVIQKNLILPKQLIEISMRNVKY
jgi:hypothetical protein